MRTNIMCISNRSSRQNPQVSQ